MYLQSKFKKYLDNSVFGSNNLGDTFLTLPVCHSTNDKVASLLREGSVTPGLVLRAVAQDRGRGQRGNSWLSDPGENLTFTSLLLPSQVQIQDQFLISKYIALAIVQLLDDLGVSDAFIKWPNDIFIGDLKVAGILIENLAKGRLISSSIVGIGLNVNQKLFEGLRATSLRNELGEKLDLELLLKRFVEVCKTLEKVIDRNGIDLLNRWYLERLLGYNQRRFFEEVATRQEFVGTIKGVNEFGHLMIKTEEGQLRTFDLKEVRFLFSE